MKILRCSCRQCKALRNSGTGKSNRKVAVRSFRRRVRDKLSAGDYDRVPVAIGMDYNS